MFALLALLGLLTSGPVTPRLPAPSDLTAYLAATRGVASGATSTDAEAVAAWDHRRASRAIADLRRAQPDVATLERAAYLELWLAERADEQRHLDDSRFHRDRGMDLVRALPRRDANGFRETWYVLATLGQLAAGQLGEARTIVEAGLAQVERPARLWLASGMVNEAAAALDRSADLVTDGVSHPAPGRAVRLRLADAAFRKALELAPDLDLARLRLGRIASLSNQPDSTSELQRVVAHTSDRNLRYLAHLFLGRDAARRGDLAASERAYEEARSTCPTCQSAVIGLSELAYRGGQVDVARQLVGALAGPVSARSDDPWWGYMLGNLEREGARRLLREAVR